MDKLLRDVVAGHRSISIPSSEGQGHSAAPLFAVLWRRRWTLGLTVIACALFAGTYLFLATPIYSSTSKVAISQNGANPYSDNHGYVSQSDSYMQTQGDIFLSTSVLARALDATHYRSMKTFSTMKGDPVAWVRALKSFKVEVARKSDVIAVSLESPYPREAALFVNSVINSYIEEQSHDKRSTGSEMVKVLQRQKLELQQKRDLCLAQMIEAKRQSGVLSLKDDKANTVMERAEALNTSLTNAQLETIALRSQLDSMTAALATPESIAAFVEAQQAKGKESGDPEYQELRSQMTQLTLNQTSSGTMQGPNHPRVQVLSTIVDSLKQRIAAKQRTMVESQRAALNSQVVAAEGKERQIRTILEQQEGRAIGLGPKAVEFAKLEAEVSQLQKQSDMIDARVGEISVNTLDVGPLNVKVLEQARIEETPVKPNKPLILAAAAMLGCMLGMGLAILREWQDARLRTPEEIFAVLGTPVLATVPRINPQLSSVNRGQSVRLDSRSITAEAYRSVRTSLYLGLSGKARTILVASPMPGDGKSTTASNLAIAFAQAGDRTLLIDCDLREPVQHLIFETAGNFGLSNVMTGDVKLRDAVRPTRSPGLYVLPCGPVPANPAELLSSKRFGRLIQALSKSFDRIIIDSSPLLRFSDTRILAASADVTILVLRMNQSMRTLGVLAINGLQKIGANVVGAVANDVPSGKAYPYYGGSSQYVAPARAIIAQPGSNGNRGDAWSIARPSEKVVVESLAISEPDWSTDML